MSPRFELKVGRFTLGFDATVPPSAQKSPASKKEIVFENNASSIRVVGERNSYRFDDSDSDEKNLVDAANVVTTVYGAPLTKWFHFIQVQGNQYTGLDAVTVCTEGFIRDFVRQDEATRKAEGMKEPTDLKERERVAKAIHTLLHNQTLRAKVGESLEDLERYCEDLYPPSVFDEG